MERRRAVGLAVLGAGLVALLVGISLDAGHAPAPLATPFLAVGWLVMNPIALVVILVLMFRRPSQQQQQVVIHLGAGTDVGSVSVQCGACRHGNRPGVRFCGGCGRGVA